jgi:hypothetical protein
MKRMPRAAILTELTDQMAARGSWCGETHLQKSAFFLQELLGVPMEFEFTLYKYGPYSFDLGDELTALQADELLALKMRHRGYGPSYETTETSRVLRTRFPVTLGKFHDEISFVARTFGEKGVVELERLATALFVTRENPQTTSVDARARRLHQLKPHVSIQHANAAIAEFDAIAAEARELLDT